MGSLFALALQMQNREQIIQEYFLLRVFLNRANKLADQKSELKFEIIVDRKGTYSLWARADAGDESHGLILLKREGPTAWYPFGFSGFESLENFCRKRLNAWNQEKNLQALASRLQKELASFRIK